jgi:hypothetical protein
MKFVLDVKNLEIASALSSLYIVFNLQNQPWHALGHDVASP